MPINLLVVFVNVSCACQSTVISIQSGSSLLSKHSVNWKNHSFCTNHLVAIIYDIFYLLQGSMRANLHLYGLREETSSFYGNYPAEHGMVLPIPRMVEECPWRLSTVSRDAEQSSRQLGDCSSWSTLLMKDWSINSCTSGCPGTISSNPPFRKYNMP